MVPIPRGSTVYKVAARESAPSGELPSNRHDEREPVQSQYHLTCGRDRRWPLDGNARHLSKKKERDIMQSLTPKAPYKGLLQEFHCLCLQAISAGPEYATQPRLRKAAEPSPTGAH